MQEQDEESGPTDTHDLILRGARVIEPALTVCILPLFDLSLPGIFAFSRSVMVGEATDVRLLDFKECTRVTGSRIKSGMTTSKSGK